MPPHPTPAPVLVHCTNAYPLRGDGPEAVLAALEEHAVGVRERAAGGGPLPIGLYLPAAAAEALVRGERIRWFKDRLDGLGLEVHTLNGFPYGGFFTPASPGSPGAPGGDRFGVYRPGWGDRRRVDQTLHLAAVLAELLPAGVRRASISTLPVGWLGLDGTDFDVAAAHLREVAAHLQQLKEQTGVRLTLDLEPEPGCILDGAARAIEFLEPLLGGAVEREHLGICHDICHSAVLFEEQAQSLEAYREAGIRVNKVQVSSALDATFDGMDPPLIDEAVAVLRALPGDRSLRQTAVLHRGSSYFFEDLSVALKLYPQPGGRWRVHHHLPLTLETLGPLRTTRDAVADAFADLAAHGEAPLLEAETYTWSTLPAPLRLESLAGGLAAELAWARAERDRAWPA